MFWQHTQMIESSTTIFISYMASLSTLENENVIKEVILSVLPS